MDPGSNSAEVQIQSLEKKEGGSQSSLSYCGTAHTFCGKHTLPGATLLDALLEEVHQVVTL